MSKTTSEIGMLQTILSDVKEKQEKHVFQQLENLKNQLSTIGDLNIDQIAELRLSNERINKKLKDDLEAMRIRILEEVEPIVEKRA